MTTPRLLSSDEWKLVAARRLRAVDAAPYLASLLLAMPVYAVENTLASVDRSARLYLDIERFAALGEAEAVGLLLHEVGHVVHGHADRAESRGVLTGERATWNLAGDLTINDDLLAGGFALPAGGVDCESVGVEPGRTVEAYFDQLRQDTPDDSPSCGSGAGGESQPWEFPDAEGDERGGDADGLGRGLTALDLDLQRRHVAGEITRHVTSHGSGSVSPALRAWAEEQLAPPKVHWRDALRTAVRRPLQIAAGVDDYSWHRPNRRRRSGQIILPTTISAVPTLAVVVDTSGSIRDGDIAAFTIELAAMAVQFRVSARDVAVVPCALEAAAPIPADRVIGGERLAGGGGTDMRAGIAAAEHLRPCPDVIVVFTDGITPWPETSPNVPVVVALTRSIKAQAVPGWATTIVIDEPLRQVRVPSV